LAKHGSTGELAQATLQHGTTDTLTTAAEAGWWGGTTHFFAKVECFKQQWLCRRSQLFAKHHAWPMLQAEMLHHAEMLAGAGQPLADVSVIMRSVCMQ
jgi:hypothetical protein